MFPYIRRIQYTYRYRETILGNYAQLINYLTAGCLIDAILGVCLGDRLRDGVAHPEDGVALT